MKTKMIMNILLGKPVMYKVHLDGEKYRWALINMEGMIITDCTFSNFKVQELHFKDGSLFAKNIKMKKKRKQL